MLASMTAFTRIDEQGDFGRVTIELRSVNHRYLDLSFRLPESLRELESDCRELLSKTLIRGKVECKMHFTPSTTVSSDIGVNHELVKGLLSAADEITHHHPNIKPLSLGKLLSWQGVLQMPEVSLDDIKPQILAVFSKAVSQLHQHRLNEGTRIKDGLMKNLSAIVAEVDKAKEKALAMKSTYQDKLLTRFDSLAVDLAKERVEAELALLLQRLDVSEEIDRLSGHCQEVSTILKQSGRAGRRLDFLMQELNREANTLGSKSVDLDLTASVVELKVHIEQMREQIQNLV